MEYTCNCPSPVCAAPLIAPLLSLPHSSNASERWKRPLWPFLHLRRERNKKRTVLQGQPTHSVHRRPRTVQQRQNQSLPPQSHRHQQQGQQQDPVCSHSYSHQRRQQQHHLKHKPSPCAVCIAGSAPCGSMVRLSGMITYKARRISRTCAGLRGLRNDSQVSWSPWAGYPVCSPWLAGWG